jgi:hypothetical protein
LLVLFQEGGSNLQVGSGARVPSTYHGVLFGGAGKHVRKNPGVVFTLQRAPPLTGVRRFAPATPGHQRQPKSGGGVGQGRGRCGSWLTHPPCLCPPRGRAADAGLLLPNNRPAPDTRRRSPAAVLPSRPVISWFHGRGCEAGSGLGYLGREWPPRPRDVRGWPRRPQRTIRAAEARAPSSRGRTWLLSTVGATSCSQ